MQLLQKMNTLIRDIKDRLCISTLFKEKIYVFLAFLKKEITNAITPVNEKPMNIPKVPPTLPINPISFMIKYSSKTLVYSGLPK